MKPRIRKTWILTWRHKETRDEHNSEFESRKTLMSVMESLEEEGHKILSKRRKFYQSYSEPAMATKREAV